MCTNAAVRQCSVKMQKYHPHLPYLPHGFPDFPFPGMSHPQINTNLSTPGHARLKSVVRSVQSAFFPSQHPGYSWKITVPEMRYSLHFPGSTKENSGRSKDKHLLSLLAPHPYTRSETTLQIRNLQCLPAKMYYIPPLLLNMPEAVLYLSRYIL